VYILAWTLSHRAEATVDAEGLVALHNEIRTCADLMGAQVLEASATSGLLLCDVPQDRRGSMTVMSAADAAVRCGQLICRWSSEEEVAMRVGVHHGPVDCMTIPGTNQLGYFGSAVSTARRLADTSPKDRCVNLLASTKDYLCVFERLSFSVLWNASMTPATEAYYLDPWTEALNTSRRSTLDVRPSSRSLTTSRTSTKSDPMSMNDLEFSRWLISYGIDTTRFGVGQAKRLRDLRLEIQDEKKSRLVERAGVLERHLEIVRMSVFTKDSSGNDRRLTMTSEFGSNGRKKLGNQKLCQVVAEGRTWQEVMDSSFLDKFQLKPATRKELIAVESEWVKEERLFSQSVPGIQTIYIVHEAKLRIVDPNAKELESLGLPSLSNFTIVDKSGKTMQWCWSIPNSEECDYADELASLLQEHNISIHEFAPGAFEDLLDEVYTAKSSSLMVKRDVLLRNCQVVKVWLSTDIMNVPHVLVTQGKVLRGVSMGPGVMRPISMRIKVGQPWQDSVTAVLTERLGLEPTFQKENIILDQCTYKLSEEIELSTSYPGLKTVYRIHEVTCRILATHPDLGLPDGNDFSVSRTKLSRDSGIEDVVTTFFQWMPLTEMITKRDTCQKDLVDYEVEKASDGPDAKRRVSAPTKPELPPAGQAKLVVEALMEGKQTDWKRAWSAARRIRDADYSCQDFFEDCAAAFPELALYMAATGDGAVSSGRSADDEYQRTIGALFAVYWLMRLDNDGARAFAFGVGEDWKTLSVAANRPRREQAELRKRVMFLECADWSLFEAVFTSAGLLSNPGGPTRGRKEHNAERTLAMLVLTAIHDIMKLQALLPTVAERHAPFCGYQAGEVIGDHDLALAYVLVHCPKVLPSFAGLPEAQQQSVRFTQSGMEYNMGWLVQAEAPPGALFRKFKSIIGSGEVNTEDIWFYFTHWLTDLAGAEPYPQEGCEKYVLKFPMKVLQSFLNSFNVVQHLNNKSETEVYEDYLVWRWSSHKPTLGDIPTGTGSIARLRLVVMAQGHSQKVLEAFSALSYVDQEVLSVELACTGCLNQSYVRDPPERCMGPAFLVYYAPALLQKNCSLDPEGVLSVLAEVLRRARELWPFQESAADETVTLRIDALKELEVHSIQEARLGEYWLLEKTSSVDAVVKRVNILGSDGQHKAFALGSQRILTFGVCRMDATDSGKPAIGEASYVERCTSREAAHGDSLHNSSTTASTRPVPLLQADDVSTVTL